jgi:hypothetical protein
MSKRKSPRKEKVATIVKEAMKPAVQDASAPPKVA